MGRSDWEYVFNTFAFGYAVGYHFIQTKTGAMNGNFLGIGADLALNASVLVDASQPFGLLITNGEFTAFRNKNFSPKSTAIPRQVLVSPSNVGAVKFVNTAFWGKTDSIADLSGSGTVSFVSCTFVEWDLVFKSGSPAIIAREGLLMDLFVDRCECVVLGKLIVQGSEFQRKGLQIDIGKKVGGAVVVGNIMTGPVNITNAAGARAQIGYNIGV